ncbi:MAG: hypothetical protein JRJ79_17995 [Deltaproteobacteria bacterium]|nr:hypothetical protein [Deltaproteobacteria bacterium]
MPPIDERIKENTSKSVRNGFIFFVVATAFLMLPFSVRLVEEPDTVQVLGALFIAAGAAYLLSYLYYERVEPRLGERSMKLFKTFILIAGISLGALDEVIQDLYIDRGHIARGAGHQYFPAQCHFCSGDALLGCRFRGACLLHHCHYNMPAGSCGGSYRQSGHVFQRFVQQSP